MNREFPMAYPFQQNLIVEGDFYTQKRIELVDFDDLLNMKILWFMCSLSNEMIHHMFLHWKCLSFTFMLSLSKYSLTVLIKACFAGPWRSVVMFTKISAKSEKNKEFLILLNRIKLKNYSYSAMPCLIFMLKYLFYEMMMLESTIARILEPEY